MPMLGDLLAAARDGAGNFLPWLRTADAQLATDIENAARQEAMTATTYVRAAISDFSRFASEEDWATLTSNLKRTDDPGTICLLAMVDWRLNARACRHHSHQHFPEGEAADERSQPRSA